MKDLLLIAIILYLWHKRTTTEPPMNRENVGIAFSINAKEGAEWSVIESKGANLL